ILCLCPFASNFNRSLPSDKTVEIAEELSKASGLDVVIMGSKDQLSGFEISSSKVHKLPDVSIFTAMSVIGMSHFIVSVDTSFAHISNFYDKRGLFIYNQEMWDNFAIRIVFGANYENANYLVSPTYAVRDLTPQQIISAAIPLIGEI
ncbi:glycosyltransferase family 9 protein, partial [Streptococcus pneumoniae]|uniref:glycosyltransferase family 9 protein n=1 Tax=Streptococcus pneumoniae TaxID=1313 RepID=UPI002362EEEE